jgi:fructoselysine-6-P-deglycase FrlB-like protein
MKKEELQVYSETIKKAINQQSAIATAVTEFLKKEIKNVFLVGCGGSLGCMFPFQYIFETKSKLFSYIYNSAEFLAVKPVKLNHNSLVILSSYTGTTRETVAAASYANNQGAITIGFTGEAESALGQEVDYVFANKADSGVTDSKLIMLYQLVFKLLAELEAGIEYQTFIQIMSSFPAALVAIKKSVLPAAIKFAEAKKEVDFFMTLGAGPCWGEAYVYATCILEEMQWIKAQPVHAGEYFHGAFEIVRSDTELILFKGEDRTRSLIERVEEFSKKYSQKITLIDTIDYPLPGIAAELREFLSPLILSAVMDVYSQKLAEIRNHSLTTRKYMGKVDY